MKYVYLGSPYSSPDPAVRASRFDSACRVAARLMRAGAAVFSPIAHSHPIDLADPLPQTTEFWMEQDLPILRHASKLMVLRIPGWEASKGLAREIEAAKSWGIPIGYVDE